MSQKFKQRARLHYPEYENNIADLRLAHNITITELAEIAGCDPGTIVNLQGGHIPPFYVVDRITNGKQYWAGDIRPYVEKICKYFNESPGDLFPRDICDIQRHELFKDQVSDLLIGQYSKNEYDPDTWQIRERLLRVLKTLHPRETIMMVLMYWHGYSMVEVAKFCDLTRARIAQIHTRSLRKLRDPTRSRFLKDFV